MQMIITIIGILRTTFEGFVKHHSSQMAAAIAYYMIFSLPAILLITITIGGYLARWTLGSGATIREQMIEEVGSVVGAVNVGQVAELIDRATQLPPSAMSIVFVVILLLFSASGVVVQVQIALNAIWKYQPDEERLRNRNFFRRRLLAVGFVLVVGFLLLLSLVLSATLATMGDVVNELILRNQLPSLSGPISVATDFIITVLLFTAVYRWLHDTKISWKFSWLGGLVSALLFMLGKTLLALLLTRVNLGSAYGAAGSLAVLLAWCYYSALAFLLGAELTRSIEAHTTRVAD